MFKAILERFRQKHRTVGYPDAPPTLPDRLRGRPVLNHDACPADCRRCADACPVAAVSPGPSIDLGRCLFCGQCESACERGAIRFTVDAALATRNRDDLLVGRSRGMGILPMSQNPCVPVSADTGRMPMPPTQRAAEEPVLAAALDAKMKKLFGRSLKLRQVSAGGCNACEADINVLTTVVFDLGRFGIQVVASPRHADGLLITGPVTANMRLALEKTYAALPAPKLVVAVGACAISGGLYADQPETCNGAAGIVPVDLFIPGCPPHPITILDGLLRLMGKIGG